MARRPEGLASGRRAGSAERFGWFSGAFRVGRLVGVVLEGAFGALNEGALQDCREIPGSRRC